MHGYEHYLYPEYEGPVITPLIPNEEEFVKINPVFGPVPNPSGTQEQFNPKIPCKPQPPVLSPLPHLLPPEHTQIKPRCFTCEHFEMCKFKKDYLKTIKLIQNCLGAPQEDYELTNKYIRIPEFIGFPLMNQEKYFPQKVTFDNEEHQGQLFMSRFNGINYVNIVYLIKNTYILLQLKYNKETELYELKSCEEAFYGVKYELNEKSLEEIQLGLVDWRELIINTQIPHHDHCHHKDVINTTHFSSSLDCDMYQWNKMNYEDAIKYMIKKYPHGIPIDEHGKTLYHIATYHIENDEVHYSPLIFKDECKKHQHYASPHKCKPAPPPKRRGDF